MKRVITYGTFDLLHQGHLNILKRAKAMGDYLIVGVTSENYDLSRGKLNVAQSLMERIENVYGIASERNLILQEAIKTAYAPCFDNLINVALSGVIGEIKDVDATFTKLIQDKALREWCLGLGGGSLRELGSYPLLVIAKLKSLLLPFVCLIPVRRARRRLRAALKFP